MKWSFLSISLLFGCGPTCIDCGECGIMGVSNPETWASAWAGTEDDQPVVYFAGEVEGVCGPSGISDRLRWTGVGAEFASDSVSETVEYTASGGGSAADPWTWEGGVTAFVEDDGVTAVVTWSSGGLLETWTCTYEGASVRDCELL